MRAIPKLRENLKTTTKSTQAVILYHNAFRIRTVPRYTPVWVPRVYPMLQTQLPFLRLHGIRSYTTSVLKEQIDSKCVRSPSVLAKITA